jgi:hypothetical protein
MNRPLFASLLGLLLMAAEPAAARREITVNYPYARVWTAAVRLMRVDLECNITEKDKDDGYLLFEYPDRGKTYPGSLELIASKRDDVEGVIVVLKVPAMPTYVEGMILERLTRKLEQEFGPPKEGKRPEPGSKGGPKPADGDRDKDKPAPAPKAPAGAPK